jgi:hypothetical protein
VSDTAPRFSNSSERSLAAGTLARSESVQLVAPALTVQAKLEGEPFKNRDAERVPGEGATLSLTAKSVAFSAAAGEIISTFDGDPATGAEVPLTEAYWVTPLPNPFTRAE